MSLKTWQSLKLFLIAALVLSLQTAVLKELINFEINLVLVSIICIACFTSLNLSILTGIFFVLVINLLTYNSSFYWIYLLLAIVANQFNPKQLEDKFLVAVFYCALFSPVFELIYTPFKDNLLHKCIMATLINTLALIPMYFLIKFLIKEKKKRAY